MELPAERHSSGIQDSEKLNIGKKTDISGRETKVNMEPHKQQIGGEAFVGILRCWQSWEIR